MEENKLAPHVEEITRALGDKLSEKEIAEELQKYIDVYRLSIPMAKRTIIKKYGGETNGFAPGLQRKLGELRPNEPNVDFVAKVITANEKEIEAKGEKKTIVYGLLGDESTTLPYTIWETGAVELSKGDVVSVRGAYTREYKGRVEVHFGNRVTVRKEDPSTIEDSDVAQGPPKVVTIDQLRESMGYVEVRGRILSVEARDVTVQGEPKTIYSGTIADEADRIQFTAWNDFKLKEGDLVRISRATVRGWRGIPQLNFDDRGEVLKLKEDFPSVEELRTVGRRTIAEVAAKGGAADVGVRAVIIEVRDGSGLITRCPECRRALQKGMCKIHGRVEGFPDLRIKAVLDDGTGAVSAVFGRELTEELIGMTLDDCVERAKKSMNFDTIKDMMDDQLMFKVVDATGNFSSDSYGLSMIVRDAGPSALKVREEAEKVLLELEESG
jgi:replication factor A1